MRALLLALTALPLIAAAQPAPPSLPAFDPLLLPEEQRAFFQDGPGLLLPEEQRASFQRMDEAGRDAFIRGLLDRDPVPETPENELRLGAERRRRLASLAFRSPLDVRYQILFLRGVPAARQVVSCRLLKPLEIWGYGEGQPPLVIYQSRPGEPFRLWLRGDSRYELELPRSGTQAADCPEEAEVTRATGATLAASGKLRRLPPGERARALLRPADLAAWAREAAATPLPPEPPRLETAPLEVSFPRRQGKRLAARVLIPVVRPVADGPPEAPVTVLVTVESRGLIIEEQAWRYLVPAPSPAAGGTVPLLLELRLPPGLPSLLRLRLQDESAGAETLLARALLAPSEPAPPPGVDGRAAVRGEPLNPGDRVGRDALVLPPPPDGAVVGTWDAAPLVLGDRIVQAVFLVDGEVQSSVSLRPFTASLRFSSVPREQVVRVEGYDRDGELVAADEVVLNRVRSQFKVTLVEPRPSSPGGSPAASGGGPVRARAEVSIPPGRRLLSVELRLNDAPVATLTAPPWEAPVDIPAEGDLVFLSAVARLDNGFVAEDVRFLRAPEDLDRMNVRLVELSTRVTDEDGRLVRDLDVGDFEVLEDGRPQPLVRFDLYKDLPLNLGLLLDTSSSMIRSLPEVQHAAAEFLEHVLRGQDRAFVLGFASRPYRLLASTERSGSAVAAMTRGLPNLRGVGGTALYDAIVAALYELRSGQGRRALVVLSDGRDSASHATLQQALELARRGGVTIYAIGMDRPGQPLRSADGNPRGVLLQIAEETGGRAFFLRGTDKLSEVYGQIEEDLRSRYLLAYQTERGEDGETRPAEVRVRKRGLKVRTARGYYP